ncbi:hypothetical protein DPEC_G00311830 [Dallia pectoralis]|uniref:Uncharacterized protein n=1 Tax=Dallia pectoralis TaxID=75939 RepID=A0ACC2FB84_DALPE|nr:hypothetical protein DPEC_G00311830 [Dallia pectoralis]
MDCLSPDLVVGGGVGVGRGCWMGGYSEDEDELLPLERCSKDVQRMPTLQPKSEGSLRRRLLTSKIHQQRDALWAPRLLAKGPQDSKGLQRPVPRQGFPYPGPQSKPCPPDPVLHHQVGHSTRGPLGHTDLRMTSYSPPSLHPGFSFPPPPPSPSGAGSYTQTGPCGHSNVGPLRYSFSNPGYCNPTYNTSPSSSPRPGTHRPDHRPSFSYPYCGYPPPGLGCDPVPSPSGSGHILNPGLAPEARASVSSRRKSFSTLKLLRWRSSKDCKNPSPQTPLLHAHQHPHWRVYEMPEFHPPVGFVIIGLEPTLL